jgi:hypothetical protein
MRRIRRALVLVIDGLRPDAVTEDCMPNLTAFAERAWRPAKAVTVRPSVTVAALSSLATGVGPATHGLTSPRVPTLAALRSLRPLPTELSRLDVRTSVVAAELPAATRFLVGGLLKLGGVERLVAAGNTPRRVVGTALQELSADDGRRCVIAYLNDTDVAGHAWGWMTEAYLTAAAAIDRGLTGLAALAEDPETMLIITADHGGGGVLPHDHDHPHPLNESIPLFLGGGRIEQYATGTSQVSLLDVPPTVVHAFGGLAPAEWEGRPLAEAFEGARVWASA